MGKGNFISYVVNNDLNKYPSNGLHTDGYYYELYGEPPLKIVTWANGTDAEIVAMVNAADNGEINLADYWSVGDERQITLSAMAATGVEETHAEQTVTFVLMNSGGKTLANATPSGRSVCSFIVGMKNGLSEEGGMNSDNTAVGGWDACPRRTWCNEVFRNAIPESLREIFKQHLNITGNSTGSTTVTSTDYFALPAEKEVFGQNRKANSTAESSLTQFEYYTTAANILKRNGDSVVAWCERSPSSSLDSFFCNANYDYIESDGTYSPSPGEYYAFYPYALAPFGVI